MQCGATMIHLYNNNKGRDKSIYEGEDEDADEDPSWGPVSERSIIERDLLLDRLKSKAKVTLLPMSQAREKREKLIWGGDKGDMGSLKGRSCHCGIQASRNCTIDRLPVLKRCQPIGFNKIQTSTIIR
ncbi:uncharacterized protein EAE97_001068 [Botrytis byssoidea]|uniref:Uncharacterized protein n=1 Tax=Botrytis byssoidea TaxID=139641 RepID=A0A9P5ITR6_9HELO|nr:uncharacterized protein EAE97_001068 [Botrytis byssoidea]KAF7953669.1 hypothetical protein EAE97_001068 [Botrytis byssoidea]